MGVHILYDPDKNSACMYDSVTKAELQSALSIIDELKQDSQQRIVELEGQVYQTKAETRRLLIQIINDGEHAKRLCKAAKAMLALLEEKR
jgi:hypothetical protein